VRSVDNAAGIEQLALFAKWIAVVRSDLGVTRDAGNGAVAVEQRTSHPPIVRTAATGPLGREGGAVSYVRFTLIGFDTAPA
jgi:hypothetical protein